MCAPIPHIYPSVGYRVVYRYLGLSTTFRLIDETASHFLFMDLNHLGAGVVICFIIMAINRKVKYYVHLEALDGFDETVEGQYDDSSAMLLDIVHHLIPGGNGTVVVSYALIEDLTTHQIKEIDCSQLIEFMED